MNEMIFNAAVVNAVATKVDKNEERISNLENELRHTRAIINMLLKNEKVKNK